MRTLTITRKKSGIASLVSMQVFIEDEVNGDMLVNKIPCRKLGSLSNGEQGTFEIDENSRRVFVASNITSKNMYNEEYRIPEGTEDIVLSGKNHYSPGVGNPFYFDNNPDPEVVKKRKKGSRMGVLIFVGAVLLGVLIAVMPSLIRGKAEPKDFTAGDLTVTLTSHFKEGTDDNGELYFYDSKTAVHVFRDELYYSADTTLTEYSDFLLAQLEVEKVGEYIQNDRYLQFEYESREGLSNFVYYTAIFRTDGSFWSVQFVTEDDNIAALREKYKAWADSIVIKE